MEKTVYPFARPVYVMAKPVGDACNMRCQYCYYTDKSRFSKGSHRIIDEHLLEHFIQSYIESQATPQVLFTWHGGEPLLCGLDFYRKVMSLEEKYANGRQIDNCLQTNGTLIDDDTAQFLHDNGWLTGVSIDGPKEFHDAYRHGANGQGSFDRVIKGIETLNRHDAQWNAMAVVNNINGSQPIKFYRFFKSIGCQYIQFTPLVDANRLGELTPWSVGPEQWGWFLCEIFDEWVRNDVGSVFVQTFDATLANWAGVPPGICSLSETCGQAAVMEHNGDVYCCDHFVFPEYKLGNILHQPLTSLLYSRRQQEFGQAKTATLPKECHECKWLFACHGECPKNRLIKVDGERGKNYLCKGYRMFFAHVAPYMDFMKEKLDRGEAPADIMNEF